MLNFCWRSDSKWKNVRDYLTTVQQSPAVFLLEYFVILIYHVRAPNTCLGTNAHVSAQIWLWPHDYNMAEHKCVWAQTCVGTNVWGHKCVCAQTCVGTNMSGHKRVRTQTCLGTNVCGHNHVWAQTCLGTNVFEHKRVWAQTCLGTIVWAQVCMGT